MAVLYILYGSATGNAEYIAKDLAAKGPPSPFASVVCEPLEKFKKHADVWNNAPCVPNLRKHALLVICSTTGNADFPENASRFARHVKRKQTIDSKAFQHVAFAVLGLGDTNYDVFCGAAKTLDKKIEEAGGERIRAVACADEAIGLEDVVEPWTADILSQISKACFSDATTATPCAASAVPDEPVKQEVKEKPSVTVFPKKATFATSRPRILDMKIKSESPLFIFYGSATGNAEQIAKDLAATYNIFLSNPDAVTFFPSVVCCDLNGWRKHLPLLENPPANGGKHGVLIVTSTTGNGEPPENADRFVRWLKRKQTIAAMPFRHCAYSVLALGDTNYDVFCAIGKTIDKQLELLGGTRDKPLACADDAVGLEDVVDPWVASILLDISLACQPQQSINLEPTEMNDENVAPTERLSLPDKAPTDSIHEEKKIEIADDMVPSPAPESTTSVSSGVRTVCSILNLECAHPLEEVERTCLPKIGTSMSSCQLLAQGVEEDTLIDASTQEDDRFTVSSASSSAIHYTLKKPFESTIRNARYLTATSPDAARRAAEILSGWMEPDNGDSLALLQQAMDVYTEHFPLLVSQTENPGIAERNGKRVIELSLTLPDDFTLEYNPGDSLGLIVNNHPADVEFVLGMLREYQGILPEQRVSIDNGNPMTVRQAISREVDLSSPLKSKRILLNLSQYATNPEDRKALQLLASKTCAGESAFECFVDQQRLSVVDILQEFPSCQSIPLAALLSILPAIHPRYYSVSSSPLANQHNFSLTVSFNVVDYVTPSLVTVDQEERGLRRKKGIATSYLEALASPFLAGSTAGSSLPAMTVKIFPKPTTDFRMPSSLATPMILIGPGTGIAPFMGFLQHRRALISDVESKDAASSVVEGTWRGDFEMEENDLKISKSDANGLSMGADFVSMNLANKVGSVDVFFGCRHEDHDWLYRADMVELKREGIISKLYTAFSRDSPANGNDLKRKYVQDIMLETGCSNHLAKLIHEKNASIYICGDGNAMAHDVQNALTQIVAQGLIDGGVEAAQKYVEEMKRDKRYLVDIWTS